VLPETQNNGAVMTRIQARDHGWCWRGKFAGVHALCFLGHVAKATANVAAGKWANVEKKADTNASQPVLGECSSQCSQHSN